MSTKIKNINLTEEIDYRVEEAFKNVSEETRNRIKDMLNSKMDLSEYIDFDKIDSDINRMSETIIKDDMRPTLDVISNVNGYRKEFDNPNLSKTILIKKISEYLDDELSSMIIDDNYKVTDENFIEFVDGLFDYIFDEYQNQILFDNVIASTDIKNDITNFINDNNWMNTESDSESITETKNKERMTFLVKETFSFKVSLNAESVEDGEKEIDSLMNIERLGMNIADSYHQPMYEIPDNEHDIQYENNGQFHYSRTIDFIIE